MPQAHRGLEFLGRPAPLEAMLQPLTATQTLDRAKAAMQNGKGAGLPELLKLIEALTSDMGKVTIPEIAELIAQDAAVMSRLLTVANTLSHNPNITPLSSVEHAIHQVGFQKIRSLAVSLMLLENAGGAGNPPEQRDAAAQALCAGLIAQGAANELGSVDPEVAFACAALRQLGYIVLAGISLEHYREAQERLKTKPEDIAYRGMFGVTPLELTRKLLAGSRLPDEILRGLRDTDPEQVSRATVSNDTRVLGLADLGGRIARLTLDADSSLEDFNQKSRLLARRYDRLLPNACDLLEPAMLHVDDKITTFIKGAESAAVPMTSILRIKSRVKRDENDPAAAAPGPATTPAATATAAAATAPVAPPVSDVPAAPVPPVAAPVPPPAAEPATDSWEQQLANSLAFATEQPKPAAAPVDPWKPTLAALRETFGADEAWVFLPPARGDGLEMAHATGGNWEYLREASRLSPTERTVFGVCITRHETVAVHDTAEPTLRTYLPTWFRETSSLPGAFLLIPLAERGRGLVLIGWKQARKIAPTADQTELTRMLIATAARRATT